MMMTIMTMTVMMMVVMLMMTMMMMMILIFKTSGFLSPRPETEKLGFAGVLLRLTFAEVDICFDLSILSSFS